MESPRVSKIASTNYGTAGYEVELDINGKPYKYKFFSEDNFNMYWRMKNKGRMLNQIKSFQIIEEKPAMTNYYSIRDDNNDDNYGIVATEIPQEKFESLLQDFKEFCKDPFEIKNFITYIHSHDTKAVRISVEEIYI